MTALMQLALLASTCAGAVGRSLQRSSFSSASSLRGALLAPTAASKGIDFGQDGCQCIGLQGIPGETVLTFDNSTHAKYPAEVGSHCKAWDDGMHPTSCQDGQSPGKGNGWCAQPWCFVNACSCKGVPSPSATKFMPDVIWAGMPLYYSYATCGAEDIWSAANNDKACPNAKTEEACGQIGEGADCVWQEGACMSWEASGLCMDLPDVSPWGMVECPCIGFSGVDGSIVHKNDSYPGDLGSTCKTWDKKHSHHCKGDNMAEGCDEPWCFVNPENCKIPAKPSTSSWFPEASFQGATLHYSYETCGGKAPKTTTTTTTTTTVTTTTTTPKAEDGDGDDESEKKAHNDKKGDHDDDDDDHDHDHDDDDHDDDHDDHDDDDKFDDMQPSAKNANGAKYDFDAYADEWHEEWRRGRPPTFREMHPEVKGFTDRQSDGKPSPPR